MYAETWLLQSTTCNWYITILILNCNLILNNFRYQDSIFITIYYYYILFVVQNRILNSSLKHYNLHPI